MSLRRRDMAALAIAALTFLLGAIAWSAGPSPTGMHLILQDGQVVVASVDIGSPAALNRVQPGMVLTALDDTNLATASPAAKAATICAKTLPASWVSTSTASPAI